MAEVSIREAKAQLSKLIERALSGEQVTITKRGEPVATLSPASPSRRQGRGVGRLKHLAKYERALTREWTEEEIEGFQPSDDWEAMIGSTEPKR